MLMYSSFKIHYVLSKPILTSNRHCWCSHQQQLWQLITQSREQHPVLAVSFKSNWMQLILLAGSPTTANGYDHQLIHPRHCWCPHQQ